MTDDFWIWITLSLDVKGDRRGGWNRRELVIRKTGRGEKKRKSGVRKTGKNGMERRSCTIGSRVPVARWRQIDSWPTIKVLHVGVRLDAIIISVVIGLATVKRFYDDFYSHLPSSPYRVRRWFNNENVETCKKEDWPGSFIFITYIRGGRISKR